MRDSFLALKQASWSAYADDRAFGLMLKIGQDEIQKQQAWQAHQDEKTNVVSVDLRCFGSICHTASNFLTPHPAGLGKVSA